MEFEYHPGKSKSNKQKHGIDFEEALAIWNDSNRLEIPAKTVDEQRVMITGTIEDDIWSAVVTYRKDRTRIISVRKSREGEVRLYES